MRARFLIFPATLVMASCDKTTTETRYEDFPIVSPSEEWLEFGETHVGESESKTLYITNDGDLTLGVTSIDQGNGHPDNFSFSFDACNVVCPGDDDGDSQSGDSDTTGGTTGTTGTGKLLVPTDEPPGDDTGDTGDATTGTDDTGGTTAPIDGPDIDIDRDLLDFGDILPPNTGTDWFVVSNAGTEDLEITSAVQSGSGTFVILNDLAGEVLVPGDAKNVYVYYQPTNGLGDEGYITFTSNDPDEPERIVNFQGNIFPEDTGLDTGEPEDTGEPDIVDDCPRGDAAVEFTLDPGCYMPVEVTFEPQSLGELYDAITITSIDQERPEDWQPDGVGDEFEPDYYSDYLHERVLVYFHGEGLSGNGNVVVLPRTLDFGHHWPGDEQVEYIEVYNSGDSALELGTPTLDPACDGSFSVSYVYEDGILLEPDTSAIIEVTFSPADARDSYCTLYVQSDDLDAPEVSVNMQGNVGTDPLNVPPRVEILDPQPGYVHGTSGPMEMTIALSDPNQPVTTLSCRVRSAVLLEAKVADCTPERSTGAVTIEIDMDPFDPGIDTFQVEVIDNDTAVGMASISVIIQSRAETSDDDGDGFGDAAGVFAYDCDDQYILTYPEAAELADGRDNDCDQLIDEGTDGYDDDGDRFSEGDADCNDFDSRTYPGAPEDIDSRDNDCDGIIDEGTALYDDDGDGFSDINNDCDDRDPERNPGAAEICDNIDNDCNGVVDDECIELETSPLLVGHIKMEQTSVEEGETIQLSAFFYEGDGDELSWSWNADFGEFRDENAAFNATWTAPTLDDDSVGQRVSIYVQVEDEDIQRTLDFGEVIVYPAGTLYKTIEIQEKVPAEDTGGCSSVPALPGLLLVVFSMGAAAVRRRRE